jgi:glycosyltransferase involved in cell wall biosynthesis
MRKFKQAGWVDVRGTDAGRIRGEATLWLPRLTESRVLTIEGRAVCGNVAAHGQVLELRLGTEFLDPVIVSGPGEFQHTIRLGPIRCEEPLRFKLPERPEGRKTLLRRLTSGSRENTPIFPGDVQILRIALGSEILLDFTGGAQTFGNQPSAPGMNVFGYFGHDFGIGESARCCARAAAAAGLPVALNALKIGTDNEETKSQRIPCETDTPHSVNVFHLDPPQMEFVDEVHGSRLREGRYNIAYWAWELPEFPDYWLQNFDLVDEVWVPSRFVWEAVAAKSPVPVLVMPHAVDPEPPAEASRTAFNLRSNEFLFLTIFDFNSSLSRKNPLGAISAFRKAFPVESGVRLVVKTQNGTRHPADLAAVESAVSGAENITLLDRTMTRPELLALHSVCDCFISLHRAEGFGIALAEAMRLGKPAIATNWSGNLDFMSAANSCLVDCEVTELTATHGPYKRGQRWAEPNIHHAAFWMRCVFEEPSLRTRIGANARKSTAEFLSPIRIGTLYANRLRALTHWL